MRKCPQAIVLLTALLVPGAAAATDQATNIAALCDATPAEAELVGMYEAFDVGDFDRWLAPARDDLVFQMGDNQPIVGKQAVIAAFEGLSPTWISSHHEILDVYRTPTGATVQGRLDLVRSSDGAAFSAKFIAVFDLPLVGGIPIVGPRTIKKYAIYIDATAVLNKLTEVPD